MRGRPPVFGRHSEEAVSMILIADDPRAHLAATHQAYLAATKRDPRQAPFGYLAGDPSRGARGPFRWFRSPVELFEGIYEVEVDVLNLDERDAARIKTSILRAIGAGRHLLRVDCQALSAAFEGWSEILWVGTFNDLCAKGGEIPTSLRAACRAATATGTHGGPIDDGELPEFVRFLESLSAEG